MPLVVMEDHSGPGMDERASGRLAAIQNSVRTALFEFRTPASSVYSRSPNVQQTPIQSPQDRVKPPMVRQLFGLVPRNGDTPVLRHMPTFHRPFGPRAESITYSPATAPSEWGNGPAQPSPSAQTEFRHPADTVPIIGDEHDVEAALPPRPKKHKRKHKSKSKNKNRSAWTRKRKTQAGSRTCAALFQGETRFNALSTAISGIFLVSILAICKPAISLSR